MTQTVEDLRRESERTRAELTATVDRLKQGIADTTKDLREMLSPQHVKSEVSGYVSDKAQSWINGLKQQAIENPMGTVAAGTAMAVPLLRMARGVPVPLLMIAAGVALTSKSVRGRAANAAAPLVDRAERLVNQATDSIQAARSGVQDQLGAYQERAAGAANAMKNAVTGAVDDLRTQAAEVTGTVSDKIAGGIDALKDKAASAPEQGRQIIGDNAAIVGGMGIAIGAIIAAALPKTKVESQTIGQASDRLKRATSEAARSGLEAAKDAAFSAADAATKSVGEADLGSHASRMTRDIADTLNQAAAESWTQH